MSKYRFSKILSDPDIRKLQQEIEDNFIARDRKGNVVIDGNITAKDGFFDAESIYLGKVKISAPKPSEDEYYMRVNYSSLKKEVEWVAASVRGNYSIDGGRADSVYTALQVIDGEDA